jgi:hypothetical protein
VRRSVRAGDLDRAEGADQIHTARQDARGDISANHVQMVSAHHEITSIRHNAAADVAKAVHNGRAGTSG